MSDPALTPLEIERAVDALARHRALRQEPWTAEQLKRTFVRSARPLRSMLVQLAGLGLITFDQDGRWDLTSIGAGVLDARDAGDWGPLTTVLLRAADMERDVLAFLGEAEKGDDHVTMRRTRARTLAPLLASVIDWQPEWRVGQSFVVPLAVLQTAMSGAAMELADGRPEWVADRERVGHRAEAYSLRLAREDCGPGAILHVSRDVGDGFGYDIEDISRAPSRLIECKGSRSQRLSFVMSANELAVARSERTRYEIQYWGQIDLTRSPDEDYEALCRAGYPKVIADPAGAIDDGALTATPASWRITDVVPPASG